jgi:hypothetical protein
LSKKNKIREGIKQLKQKQENSPVWNDLIKVKDIYTRGRVMILGNGKEIDFWRDAWCGLVPLKEKFQELYDICLTQHGNVAYMAGNGWRMIFRRWLDERGQTQLRRLRDMLSSCDLSEEKDGSKWS